MRSYYNKVNGDYAQLSETDKQAYIKACGGDPDKAQKFWNMMKYGPSGAPRTGG